MSEPGAVLSPVTDAEERAAQAMLMAELNARRGECVALIMGRIVDVLADRGLTIPDVDRLRSSVFERVSDVQEATRLAVDAAWWAGIERRGYIIPGGTDCSTLPFAAPAQMVLDHQGRLWHLARQLEIEPGVKMAHLKAVLR